MRETNAQLTERLRSLLTDDFPADLREETREWRQRVWATAKEIDKRLNPLNYRDEIKDLTYKKS
ncbi:MAG: hypothetical protein JWN75_1202 [Candidatus Saccharibacteria bacterium]|nr:hypothetical protein [Candidatus Saccharibacteria bacterium]